MPHAVDSGIGQGDNGITLSDGEVQAERTPSRRYLKSFSSVYDVAGHAFELRRGRVILSGAHDAPEAVSRT
jgi:hypothetical protein